MRSTFTANYSRTLVVDTSATQGGSSSSRTIPAWPSCIVTGSCIWISGSWRYSSTR